MKPDFAENKIIFTNKTRCTDCYKCLRVCPVKAIRMKNDQTYVDEKKCIECGNCVRECPQHARTYRKDLLKAREMLASGSRVAVSVAPSFASVFEKWEMERLPSALRKLGFFYVSETASGAYHVAKETGKIWNSGADKALLCTSCPVFVTYVEKYYPSLVKHLAKVVSPMIAHARMLKDEFGEEIKILFVGPCLAKKGEAEREELAGTVDCVLTFDELKLFFEEENVSLDRLEASSFDGIPAGHARTFPLISGLIKTGGMDEDVHSAKVVSISGQSRIKEILDLLGEGKKGFLVEPLFCEMGCINGPGVTSDKNVFERRMKLLEYSRGEVVEEAADTGISLKTAFGKTASCADGQFPEEEIKRILEKTGKYSQEMELNCGACGYSTCRDKARAVLSGMAQIDMCMPYMRRIAEQRTDKIIQTSPNGIVILDEYLNILSMNRSFRKFFLCSETIYGKPISYLMDPADFERLAEGSDDLIELTVNHNRYNITCHQLLYKIKDEGQYVGIFVDVTKNLDDNKKLNKLKVETLAKAEELLKHQISLAQNLAKFLGESTAKGEEIVENLIQLTENERGSKTVFTDRWQKDIYTSK